MFPREYQRCEVQDDIHYTIGHPVLYTIVIHAGTHFDKTVNCTFSCTHLKAGGKLYKTAFFLWHLGFYFLQKAQYKKILARFGFLFESEIECTSILYCCILS